MSQWRVIFNSLQSKYNFSRFPINKINTKKKEILKLNFDFETQKSLIFLFSWEHLNEY